MRKSLGLSLLLGTATAGPVFGQESGGGGGGPLTVDGGLVIWTLVVFGLLLYVLRRSAWPVLLAAVREREQKLERQLVEAEKNRAEAAALLEEHKRLVAAARGEAQEILNKAKTVAEKERATLLAKAREEYEQLLARARKEIGGEKEKALLARRREGGGVSIAGGARARKKTGEEKEKARLGLRREAVDLSTAAAVRLLDASLDTEANRRLVTEYLAGLEPGRGRAPPYRGTTQRRCCSREGPRGATPSSASAGCWMPCRAPSRPMSASRLRSTLPASRKPPRARCSRARWAGLRLLNSYGFSRQSCAAAGRDCSARSLASTRGWSTSNSIAFTRASLCPTSRTPDSRGRS